MEKISFKSKKTGRGKMKPPTCSECKQGYKHHLFIGGRVIKNICECNGYLLEEEANRIREKRRLKELNRPMKPGQVRILGYNG